MVGRPRRRARRARSRARAATWWSPPAGRGQCFAVTTNPALSTGDGIAMAMRAGVAVADLEFMQFHPTALHHPSMPRPLLSEALRGEGRDPARRARRARSCATSTRSPTSRRATWWPGRSAAASTSATLDHLWLDATAIDGFAARFPTIWEACRVVGLDPTPRLAAGRARRALPLRWRVHRSRRGDDAPRPVGVRRSRVLGRARREPVGVELAARGPGVRGARGRGDRVGTRRVRADRCARATRPSSSRRPRRSVVATGAGPVDPRGAAADHDA